MERNNQISPSALIEKFQHALDDHWGYIWGTAGEMWTAAKQKQLEKTTDADRALSRKYGSKWIGHMVADCSGLFSWSFAQLGGYMFHGSNTMWNKYCASQGELRKGRREDGQELKPGTAIFTYNKTNKKRGHVGLFIGNGLVIEASGTIKGVIATPVTDSKWVEWGELVGVDYGTEPVPVPSGKAIVTGKNVAFRQGPSKGTPVMMRIPTGTLVDIAIVEGWTYVQYGKKYGFMMNEFIDITDRTVTVTGKNVALRAGTSTETKILTRIKTGTIVDRTSLPDDWEYISHSGKKGFMMKEFIKEGCSDA